MNDRKNCFIIVILGVSEVWFSLYFEFDPEILYLEKVPFMNVIDEYGGK
jgi:hypothetical protein